MKNQKFKIFPIFFSLNLALLMLISGCSQNIEMPTRGICAHRGANVSHPENTIPAFQEAIRLGAHMIEFDVRETLDSQLVILHDKTVDRTTNGTGNVAELTLAEIKALDAGSWKAAAFAGTKIPTLSETLEIMPKNIWLNVHIKGRAEIGAKIAQIVTEKNRVHQAVLACLPVVAAAAQKYNPKILICNMDRRSNSVEYVDSTISMQAQFIQLKTRSDEVLPELVKKLKQANVRINYFSTNEPEKLAELFKAGVDFPLVDDLTKMMQAAEENGIEPWNPIFD